LSADECCFDTLELSQTVIRRDASFDLERLDEKFLAGNECRCLSEVGVGQFRIVVVKLLFVRFAEAGQASGVNVVSRDRNLEAVDQFETIVRL